MYSPGSGRVCRPRVSVGEHATRIVTGRLYRTWRTCVASHPCACACAPVNKTKCQRSVYTIAHDRLYHTYLDCLLLFLNSRDIADLRMTGCTHIPWEIACWTLYHTEHSACCVHGRMYYTYLEIRLLVELLATLWAQPLHAVYMAECTTHTLRSDCLLNSLPHSEHSHCMLACCTTHTLRSDCLLNSLWAQPLHAHCTTHTLRSDCLLNSLPHSEHSHCMLCTWQNVPHIPWDQTACWTPCHTLSTAIACCVHDRMYYTYLEIRLLVELLATLWAQPLHAVHLDVLGEGGSVLEPLVADRTLMLRKIILILLCYRETVIQYLINLNCTCAGIIFKFWT